MASLKANGPILIVGEEGSGKSKLAEAVTKQLRDENYTVVEVKPATQKHMLTEIAKELGVETHNLEGKVIPVDQLKLAIAKYFDDIYGPPTD